MRKINLLVIIIVLIIAGCAKNRKSAGLMDDPHTHYLQGKKYWDRGDYVKAKQEFELSHSLDKKYGPAYAGLAITYAALGNMDKAFDMAEEAEDLCGKNEPAGLIAQGIVLEYDRKNSKEDDWWEPVVKFFDKAAKKNPGLGEPYFRKANTFKLAFQFDQAEAGYRKVLDLKNGYEAEADSAWQLVQKIQRAAPGTRVGKKIALVSQITRADIAALFVSELELDRILGKSSLKAQDNRYTPPADSREIKKASPDAATDIQGHWAQNFIGDLAKYNLRGLETGPDGKYYPDAVITRGEYAFFIEDILIAITGDKSLATKHVGQSTSRFNDVNSASPFYNAVCNAVDKNVMNAGLNGEFAPLAPVSGADALLIIRSLKELRR